PALGGLVLRRPLPLAPKDECAFAAQPARGDGPIIASPAGMVAMPHRRAVADQPSVLGHGSIRPPARLSEKAHEPGTCYLSIRAGKRLDLPSRKRKFKSEAKQSISDRHLTPFDLTSRNQ